MKQKQDENLNKAAIQSIIAINEKIHGKKYLEDFNRQMEARKKNVKYKLTQVEIQGYDSFFPIEEYYESQEQKLIDPVPSIIKKKETENKKTNQEIELEKTKEDLANLSLSIQKQKIELTNSFNEQLNSVVSKITTGIGKEIKTIISEEVNSRSEAETKRIMNYVNQLIKKQEETELNDETLDLLNKRLESALKQKEEKTKEKVISDSPKLTQKEVIYKTIEKEEEQKEETSEEEPQEEKKESLNDFRNKQFESLPESAMSDTIVTEGKVIKKKFKCTRCDEIFGTISALTRHTEVEHTFIDKSGE